jgi:hypothetical protein
MGYGARNQILYAILYTLALPAVRVIYVVVYDRRCVVIVLSRIRIVCLRVVGLRVVVIIAVRILLRIVVLLLRLRARPILLNTVAPIQTICRVAMTGISAIGLVVTVTYIRVLAADAVQIVSAIYRRITVAIVIISSCKCCPW